VEHNSKLKAIILLFLILSLTVFPVRATTIFSDGFESGDFSAWTGTSLNGATIAASSAQAHHGTYSAKTSGLQTAGEFAWVYKTFTAAATIYSRHYTYLATVPANIFVVSSISKWGGSHIGLAIYNPTTSKWGIYNNIAAEFYYESGTSTFSGTTWYCVEMRITASATVGVCQLWINGVLKVDVSSKNTGSTNPDTVYIGGYLFANEAAERIVYSDCCVVADAYIGPEVSGQDLTFQLSETAHLTSSLYMGKEKGFSLSEIVALTSSLIQQKELGFPLSATVKVTDSLTMNKEIIIVIHEWLYGLEETAYLTSNLYIDLEIAEKVSLGLGFYIGVLALVIALMAYLRSRH